MSAVDDALRALSAPPAQLPPATAAENTAPSAVDQALAVLNASPEELKKTQAAKAGGGFSQRAGSFATGANAAIAATLGAPADLSTWLGNLGGRGINALTGDQTVAPVTRPWLGSENIKDLLFGAVGETKPKDELDRLLYGAGAGAGSAVTGMGVGGALQAAGRAPALARMLMGGEPGLGTAVGNVATGAGAGAGGVAGEDAMRAMGAGPLAQALGGTVGGLLGGVTTAVVPTIPGNVYKAGQAAIRPFQQEGRKDIAGRILNESAVYGEPSATPGLAGTRPTFGQASNDPGLLSLERIIQQSSPDIAGRLAARASENNQAIREAVGQIGQPAGREPYQISQQAATGLEANRATARAGERAAWEAIDPTRSIQVPMQPIRDRMRSFVSDLTMARRPMVPNDILDMVMQSGGADQLPMRELQDIRSQITMRERLARRAGDYNQANIYREMDDALFQRLPEGAAPLPENADQAATMRYQNALAASRQYNETFNRSPIRDIFRVEGTPDSAVLDKMLAPGRGQAERVGQYVRATMENPELVQHGRDWFASRLQSVVGSARQDAEGDAFVLGNKLSKFVDANRPLIDSPLLTPEQRRVVNDLVEAATTVERTARAGPQGGSDTAAKLAGKNYVSAMVGDWFKPAVAAEVAGAAAGLGLGGPGGAALGAIGAGKAAAPLLERAYGGAADKVMALLAEAMLDPVFARELMRRPTQGNMQFASPKLKNFLATAPVTSWTTMQIPGTP